VLPSGLEDKENRSTLQVVNDGDTKESGRRIDTRKFHAGERAKRTEQHLRRGGVKKADSRKMW